MSGEIAAHVNKTKHKPSSRTSFVTLFSFGRLGHVYCHSSSLSYGLQSQRVTVIISNVCSCEQDTWCAHQFFSHFSPQLLATTAWKTSYPVVVTYAAFYSAFLWLFILLFVLCFLWFINTIMLLTYGFVESFVKNPVFPFFLTTMAITELRKTWGKQHVSYPDFRFSCSLRSKAIQAWHQCEIRCKPCHWGIDQNMKTDNQTLQWLRHWKWEVCGRLLPNQQCF